jgi:hypothetical protein
MFESSVMIKDGHEPARAGLGASRISARENLARLRLARWSLRRVCAHVGYVLQLELARGEYMNSIVQICARKLSMSTFKKIHETSQNTMYESIPMNRINN